MIESARRFRLTALFAAYVIGLQALLLPLSIAATAPFGGSVCVSSGAGESGPNGSGDHGCGCAAGCGTHCCAQGAAIVPPQVAFLSVATYAVVETIRLYSAHAPKPAARGPQVARPPPAV